MKRFVALIKKEFHHIFRDSQTMLILIGMPIVQIILFGFAISTEVNDIRFAVYTPSNDVMTQNIVEKFKAIPYFNFEKTLDTPDEIETYFRKNKIDVALVFEPDFEERLQHDGQASVQIITDGSDPNTALTITNYAKSILQSVQSEQQNAFAPIQIIPHIKLLYNPQMKSAYNFVPGVMGLILMLICAMMTSISIVREKERGTMEVLLVSPLKPLQIILAKVVPYLVISIINLITILLLSYFVLDVPISGSLFWLSVISFLFIFVALALGILISSIVSTQLAAMLVSGVVMMMPVMLLSGMIFPIESMPPILQGISCIIPARWYISAVKKIMIEGIGISHALKELFILLGMAILLIIVSLKKFKNRLE